MDRILLVEMDLMDTVIRLCLPVGQTGEACAEVLADGLIRELYRRKRDLNTSDSYSSPACAPCLRRRAAGRSHLSAVLTAQAGADRRQAGADRSVNSLTATSSMPTEQLLG